MGVSADRQGGSARARVLHRRVRRGQRRLRANVERDGLLRQPIGPHERGFHGDGLDDGAVAGTGSGLWDSIMEEEMDIKVTGTRDADSFHLAIEAFGKGDAWSLDVTAPINGNVAAADVNLNAPAGTYPQAEVRLECQNCG